MKDEAPNDDLVFVIMHETVLQSWLIDFGSLGSLAMLAYVNHAYAGGSVVYDILAALLLTLFFIARGCAGARTSPRFTRDELAAWLRSIETPDASDTEGRL